MSVAALVAVAVLTGACSSSDNSNEAAGATTPATQAATDGVSDNSTTQAAPPAPSPRPTAGACDPVDPAACLLPWPNDRFTRADDTTSTGLRVDIPPDGTPVNVDDVPIAVDEFNRNDGFSPASVAMAVIPDLDPQASELAPVTDIGRSLEPDSSLVMLDLDTGERIPAWAELDARVEDPQRQPLLVVPAVGLVEGHRHAVALRGLVTTGGTEVEPPPALVDQLAAPDELTAALTQGLGDAGIDLDEVDLAWNFTVSSAESLSGRLRHMWTETATDLGDGAPTFTVDSDDGSGPARIVRGTFEMPKYLAGDGSTGSVFNNDDDPDGIPTRDGTMASDFVCTVPANASADDPAPVVLYGHGLLGNRDQVLGIGAQGATAGVAFCALDWIGMSTTDVPTVISVLQDVSRFRTQPDRLQQGHLAWLLLGRLVASDAGFRTHPSFQDESGAAILDGSQISFLGASQGGILGGPPSALTSDWTQVVLAVGGMGYNLLIPRSIDFDEFEPVVAEAYPDALERSIALEMTEMLWDRGENAGWAQHLTTSPYDGAPAKTVMLLQAFADHQVANVSTEKLARTLDIPRRAPTLAERRSTDDDPFFGIDEIPSLPHQGSGLVVWDFGTPAPPTQNIPPREGEDPHGKLAEVPEALLLVLSFIEPDGAIIEVCPGEPCQTLP